MLLSAVSLIAALVVSGGNDLSDREMKAWKKIQPSVVLIVNGDEVRGSAALISREGLFIAHATAVPQKKVDARRSDGSFVKLEWVAFDEPTQFVLLRAEEWTSTAVPISVVDSDAGSKSLLALTSTGPVRAERAKDTFGIMNPSRRVVPMTEVRLENNIPSLGGALLFDLNGKLAGALNATLSMSAEQNVQKARSADNSRGNSGLAGGGGGPGAALAPKTDTVGQFYGPGILTAAYTVGPQVMRRVVIGFLSSDRVVKHPAIGVFCRDAVPQGALIDSVTPGSPADKAGLFKGDIIYRMDKLPVGNLIDFSKIISTQEVGDTIKIWIQRGSLKQMITVQVGAQDES